MPRLRIDAAVCAAPCSAQEHVVDAAEVFFENIFFVEAFRSVGLVAVELLEPLYQAVAVEHALHAIVVVHLFSNRLGSVILEPIGLPVQNGVAFLFFATVFADEKQVDEALANASQFPF